MTKLDNRVTRLERRGGGGHLPRPSSAIERHEAREVVAKRNLCQMTEKYSAENEQRPPVEAPRNAREVAAEAVLVGDTPERKVRDDAIIEDWAKSKPSDDDEAARWVHRFYATRLLREHARRYPTALSRRFSCKGRV